MFLVFVQVIVVKDRIKVLIVDDSALMRKALREIIMTDEAFDVVGVARDGKDAIEKVKELKPDVITMDINMPEMDGLTSMQYILDDNPEIPVIIISSLTQDGALTTFEALALGAFDFVAKPSGTVSSNLYIVGREIIEKIKLAYRHANRKSLKKRIRTGNSFSETRASEIREKSRATRNNELSKVVVIGVSTGGPGTLMEVLPRLQSDLKAALIVVQHMPPSFTSSFAKRLGRACPFPFKEAEAGDVLADGRGYLAPGGYQLLVHKAGRMLRLSASPDDINALFRIFHSIKGSSQMIGYDDIGNLTHKMEDMLDIVRKGRIDLDGQILQLCFSGVDHVKQLFESKKNRNDGGNNEVFMHAVEILEGKIDKILKANSETESSRKNTSQGDRIVSALKGMERTGKNRYCICISFSDDLPMISPILFMIFNNIKDIGSLVYTDVSDEDIYEASANTNISSLSIIMDSDLEEAELYTYLDVMYVEKVAIADISEHQMLKQAVPYEQGSRRFFEKFFLEFPKLYPVLFQNQKDLSKAEYTELIHEPFQNILEKVTEIPVSTVEQNLKQEIETFYDLFLHATSGKMALHDKTLEPLRPKYLKLFEMAYGYVKGKFFYKIFKVKNNHFINNLQGFIERMNKSCTRKLLLDLSRLEMIHEHELKSLIELKRRLHDMGIVMSVVIDSRLRKRLINIFDSIQTIEHFELFDTEVDAALGNHISVLVNEKRCMGDFMK